MPDDASRVHPDAADSTPNDAHDGPHSDAPLVDRDDERPTSAVPEAEDGYEPL